MCQNSGPEEVTSPSQEPVPMCADMTKGLGSRDSGAGLGGREIIRDYLGPTYHMNPCRIREPAQRGLRSGDTGGRVGEKECCRL